MGAMAEHIFQHKPQTLDEALEVIEEARKLIQAQGLIIRELQDSGTHLLARVAELEEQLRLSSRNSSKPPSGDGPGAGGKQQKTPGPEKGQRKPGGQPGHTGHHREASREPDTVVMLPPPSRCPCGGEIRDVDTEPAARHQLWEIPPPAAQVTEYRRYAGRCSCCDRRITAPLPPEVPEGMLGPRAQSMVGMLTGAYRLSIRQTQQLIAEWFGLDVSVGVLSGTQVAIGKTLAAPMAEIAAAARQAAVVHIDETGYPQQRERGWLWTLITPEVSLFRLQPQRTRAVALDLLGEQYGGIVISDRYTVYDYLPNDQRQVCWAHLLRDFQRIAERPGEAGAIGERLLSYGRQTFKILHAHEAGSLSDEGYHALLSPLRRLVHLELEAGKEGDHAPTANTCERLLKLEPALWTFTLNEAVEPTNNAAEQALRPAVIKRKLSFGTRSKAGATFLERFLSVAATCRKQGKNLLDYLHATLHADIKGQPPPPLLSG